MIGGILLAAGRSRRMGSPKLTLPWKDGAPVIAHMVQLFREASVDPIVVVTGAHRQEIEACLAGLPVLRVYNAEHASQGMIGSVRVGLQALLERDSVAAFVTPADLPRLKPATIAALMAAFRKDNAPIIVPSVEDRRGHPVLLPRHEWDAVLKLPRGRTLRDFLHARSGAILHVAVEDTGIILDMDTPGDYASAVTAAPE